MTVEGMKSDPLVVLVKRNFNIDFFPFLSIDLAVSLNVEKSVVFPDTKFFKKINIKPTYFLF